MDLHLIPGATATPGERAAIDTVIGIPATSDNRAVRRTSNHRDLLLPALHAAQDQAGFITPGALNYICQRLDVPPAEAYGVASFYAMFSTEPQAQTLAHVCDDLACRVNGALDRSRDLTIPWKPSPCLGLCDRAPAIFIQRTGAPHKTTASAAGLPSGPRLLRNLGRTTLEAYGPFNALERAREMGPDAVTREVTESGLVGRGGAAFPTGRKWQAVAAAPAQPHYLVCNADESEPGTFKDRLLMEEDPLAIVEAMAVAGYATGCRRSYLYIRGEYPLALQRMQQAIAASANLLGDFEIEVRRGAGAYICGEETALFNSIEGFRGEPRNKPPFPTEAGLFGKPTVVNNVETLLNVLTIVLEGAPAFKQTETKLFCVSGCVQRPGVYEVPFGTTLRELIAPSGVRGPLQAALLGGAAGSFLTSDQLDVALTFEATRVIGATLGSGAVIVFDDTVDMKDIVARIAAFFRDESCGQCVPCRVGTVRLEEAVHRMSHQPAPADLLLVDEIAQAMRDASICGLGQTAPSALQSAIRLGLLR